ncbi:hypothetical protein [Microcoleus sp. PH2017_32_RDM_D_A]|uniref:hypothetical protein n=1 Tax=Microcoleus sp. PH2017_32_RDM_D_A TaxID=2798842 RepID=UPI0025F0C4D3|nr:hypothetical protein [Microcoleus sp. PH2017_32_RDM_D_A]
MVESPPVFEGEIKIRLFITPILFLLGRGRSQTVKRSTVNCQLLSTVEVFSLSHPYYLYCKFAGSERFLGLRL